MIDNKIYQEIVEILSQREFFAVYGAIFGIGISWIGNWLLNRQQYKLRLWDKLLDKRIAAQENVIYAAKLLQSVTALGGLDESNNLKRIPIALLSKDNFDNSFASFTELTQINSCWLTLAAKHEVNFIQDYLVNVNEIIRKLPESELEKLALTLHVDFVILGGNLEKIAYSFFESGVLKFELEQIKKWHKYKPKITYERLYATELYKNYISEK